MEMGSPSVLSYLNQLLKGQKLCYRQKIMFVGQENVGWARAKQFFQG